MKTLILLADGFEDLQFFAPWYRLREEGVQITLAGPTGKTVVGKNGYSILLDMPIREVNPSEYDQLLIPGGYSPEKLRLREEAVDVARTFMDDDRRVVVIGHAAQLLISASALSGRQLTCSPEIRDDIRASGGVYRDESVVCDGNLISCRSHEELPELYRAMFGVRV
jgi:protease I